MGHTSLCPKQANIVKLVDIKSISYHKSHNSHSLPHSFVVLIAGLLFKFRLAQVFNAIQSLQIQLKFSCLYYMP